jgi:DNA-binding NtrC family response regulator
MLEANQWNRKKAARSLNISYRALLYKLKEAGLQSEKDEMELRGVISPEAS